MDYQIGKFKHVAGDLVQIDNTPYQIVSKKAFVEMRHLKNGDTVKIGYDPDEPSEPGDPIKAFFITSTTGKSKSPILVQQDTITRKDLIWQASIIAAALNQPKNTKPDKLVKTASLIYHATNINPDTEQLPLESMF